MENLINEYVNNIHIFHDNLINNHYLLSSELKFTLLNTILTRTNDFDNLHYDILCHLTNSLMSDNNIVIDFNITLRILIKKIKNIHNLQIDYYKLKLFNLLMSTDVNLDRQNDNSNINLLLKNSHICNFIDINTIFKYKINVNNTYFKPYIFLLCDIHDCIICNMLHIYNSIDKLNMLLDAGANINVEYNNMNCLEYAIFKKKYKIAQCLVIRQINFNLKFLMFHINIPTFLIKTMIANLINYNHPNDLLIETYHFIQQYVQFYDQYRSKFIFLITCLEDQSIIPYNISI